MAYETILVEQRNAVTLITAGTLAPGSGPPFWVVLSAGLFGLGHFYEGTLAVVQTAVLGAYFGFVFIFVGCLGLLTPPVGTVLNVVAGVGRMRMDEVVRGVIPFMLAQFAIMFLLVLFPSIVLVPMRWFVG